MHHWTRGHWTCRTPWRCTQGYRKEGHISDTSKTQIQSVSDESCLTKNSLLRNGGYSPSQWVLGKAPREAPSLVSEDQFADLGAIEDQVDPESRSAFQHQARLEAKKALIHLDTSKRVQRALLRSAKPIPQTFSVGDVVCFRRDNQPGKTTWSPASRVIGHEGNENQNVWVLCEKSLFLSQRRTLGQLVMLRRLHMQSYMDIASFLRLLSEANKSLKMRQLYPKRTVQHL